LIRKTQVIIHREGGDASASRKSPGITEFAPIELERGVTHDLEFEKWANKVWNFGAGSGSEISLRDFRKDIILDLFNEAGQKVISYKIYRCWVSEFQALPELDSNSGVVAIQRIVLENEGWERDNDVKEPTEPSFTIPSDRKK
jgi:phage tail-like protein